MKFAIAQQLSYYFWYIIKISVSFVNKYVFQILKVHHATAINNKWKIMFYVAFMCKLWTKVTKMSTNIFDANKLFIHVHPVSCTLNTNEYVFYVWCSSQCSSSFQYWGCWSDVNKHTLQALLRKLTW
jgi:hypothetical protein